LDVRRIRQAASAALLTALLVAPLAGCTDDTKAEPGDPTSSPTSSPTVTTEPSPTPTGPTLPPAAQGDDEESAKAFVRFYFRMMTTATVTGDTAAMLEFSTKRCASCQSLAKDIDEVYGMGGSFRTKGWVPNKFIRGSLVKGGHEFFLRVQNHARTLLDGKKVVDRKPASVISLRVVVMRKENTWRLVLLEVFR